MSTFVVSLTSTTVAVGVVRVSIHVSIRAPAPIFKVLRTRGRVILLSA